MAGPLADVFFWIAVVVTAVAHWFIIRSTLRAIRTHAQASRGVWEWIWALLPAATLVALFVWTWHTMHPDTLTFLLPPGRAPIGAGAP